MTDTSFPTTETALRAACLNNDLPTAKFLLQSLRAQLSPDPVTPTHLQSALSAAITSGHSEIVSYLLSQSAELTPYSITQSLYHDTRSMDMFQVFLDNGWDINARTNTGSVALKHVVDSLDLTTFFLSHGANPNPGTGISILDVAAASSPPAVFDLLIAHGAKIEESDALHSAAGEWEHENPAQNVEMMKHLIDNYGLDVNVIEQRAVPEGRGLGRGTPLHSAVYSGRKERVAVLLEKGADRRKRNTVGQTAEEFAVKQEMEGMVEVLEGDEGVEEEVNRGFAKVNLC